MQERVVNIDDAVRKEAVTFGRYLIGTTIHDAAVQVYAKALGANKVPVSAHDTRLLSFVRSHPQLVGLVDSGLAVVDSGSEVRRRIYVLFSILESMPDYHVHFLPQSRNPFYFINIGFAGAFGIIKTICGSILVKAIK
jgi:hypothetical protein